MKKTGLLVLVLLLAIGFAAVATTLLLNGTAVIGANQEDFEVYFSSATTDDGGTALISNDKKAITYSTKLLKNIDDTAELEYTVKNDSANYDANVTVTWSAIETISGKDYSSYYTVSRTGFDTNESAIVTSKSSVDGIIVITLVKPVLDDINITFTMTLDATAVERDTLGEGNDSYVDPNYTVLSGALNDVGSIVKIADEEFYVIGQEDETHVKLLSKWNLNVGSNYYPNGTIGIQNEHARATHSNPNKYSHVYFSENNFWYDSVNEKIYDEYGGYERRIVAQASKFFDSNDNVIYPYIYNNNKVNGKYIVNLAQYVDNYVEYLSEQGVNVTGRLMK